MIDVKNKLRKIIKRFTASVLNKSGMVNRRLKKGGVIILMFHKINDERDPQNLTIPPSVFDQILTEIKKKHKVVFLETLFDANGDLIVDDSVKFAITFDDGYRDNYDEAYPLLQKHNVPATIYLSYGHMTGELSFWYERVMSALHNTKKNFIDLKSIGFEKFDLESQNDQDFAINRIMLWLKNFPSKEREKKCDSIIDLLEIDPADLKVSPMLTWGMVDEMKKNNVNFGSHTLTHPILSRENRGTIEKEVVESKKNLEEKTGQMMKGFAYPNGRAEDYNDTVLEFTSNTYQHACTTTSGINYAGQDPYQLKRINIDLGMCTNNRGIFIPDLFWAKIAVLI